MMLSPKALTPRQLKCRSSKNSLCSASNTKPESAKRYKAHDCTPRPSGIPSPTPALACFALETHQASFFAGCQPTTPQVASCSNNNSNASDCTTSHSTINAFGQVGQNTFEAFDEDQFG